MLNIIAADSMGLPLTAFTQLFSKSTQKILYVPAQKWNLTENEHSRSFNVKFLG